MPGLDSGLAYLGSEGHLRRGDAISVSWVPKGSKVTAPKCSPNVIRVAEAFALQKVVRRGLSTPQRTGIACRDWEYLLHVPVAPRATTTCLFVSQDRNQLLEGRDVV